MSNYSAINCFIGYILLSLLFWVFAGYAYRVNEQLPVDDPKKKDFHPLAIKLAPITWPLLVILYCLLAVGYVFLYVIKAILFGIFIILFTLALVFIRKPFIFIWLEKVARKVGAMLLEANTMLIKLFQIPWATLNRRSSARLA